MTDISILESRPSFIQYAKLVLPSEPIVMLKTQRMMRVKASTGNKTHFSPGTGWLGTKDGIRKLERNRKISRHIFPTQDDDDDDHDDDDDDDE